MMMSPASARSAASWSRVSHAGVSPAVCVQSASRSASMHTEQAFWMRMTSKIIDPSRFCALSHRPQLPMP